MNQILANTLFETISFETANTLFSHKRMRKSAGDCIVDTLPEKYNRKGRCRKNVFLGKSPKLCVGGGQES